MGFYKRYGGLQPPTRMVDQAPGSIPPAQTPGPMVPTFAPTFPLTPKDTQAFTPTQPVRSYAPGLFDKQTAIDFGPVLQVAPVPAIPASVPGAQAIDDHPVIRKAAASDQAAVKAEQAARNADADANAAIFEANKAQAKADIDPTAQAEALRKAQSAAQAQAQADAAAATAAAARERAAKDAERAQAAVADPVLAHPVVQKAVESDARANEKAQQAKDAQSAADAAIYAAAHAQAKADIDPNATAEADAAKRQALQAQAQADAATRSAAAADAKATKDAIAAHQVLSETAPRGDGGSVPYDSSGGGYDPYGQGQLVDGWQPGQPLPGVPSSQTDTTQLTPGPTSSGGPNLLAVAAAGGGGFLAGGPIGGLIGAAVGYFLSKPAVAAAPQRASTQMARYRGFYKRR